MRAVLIVMKKELWETLRDPMVLIMSLGFPILFFPLLIWGTNRLRFPPRPQTILPPGKGLRWKTRPA